MSCLQRKEINMPVIVEYLPIIMMILSFVMSAPVLIILLLEIYIELREIYTASITYCKTRMEEIDRYG